MREYRNVALDWIMQAHASIATDECVIWPFGRTGNGYGALKKKQKQLSAHRVMCELRNGPPPPDRPFACHSCGHGKNGCVNPAHLYWGSPKDNATDAIAHGVLAKGEAQHLARLTREEVRHIRKLRGAMPIVDIAKRFGVVPGTISHIYAGKSWGWLDAA